MARLSDRAEMVMGYIRESCRFAADGSVERYMIPQADYYYGTIYGESLREGFRLTGSGDALIVKALAAAGLIRMMPAGGNKYACVITEAGMVRYEEIAARRREIQRTIGMDGDEPTTPLLASSANSPSMPTG
jgi:hypothetical protein